MSQLHGIAEDRTYSKDVLDNESSFLLTQKFDKLRPEDSTVTEMRRKLVESEVSISELQDIIEDWRVKEKRSTALEEERVEVIAKLKKQVKDLGKERNGLAHENALLELKLNKNISNGIIDEEGEAAPPTKFERER